VSVLHHISVLPNVNRVAIKRTALNHDCIYHIGNFIDWYNQCLQYFTILVPPILTTCCKVIEQHGIIDGVYRLSAQLSKVQHLRYVKV